MATYAIGDIQGCFGALQKLVEKVDYRRGRDRLLLVGDLVNRGPASLETLRWVMAQGESVTVVLGNHDLHLLAVAAGGAETKGRDTIAPILAAPDRDDLVEWLRRQPLLVREENRILVHAGLLPQWTAEEAVRLADEVQQVLRGDGWRDFLKRMRQGPAMQWPEQPKGIERLKVIVNAFTRMRFCSPDGRMEFLHNHSPENAPEGYLPWFEIPNRKSADTLIVCGHWAALGLVNRRNLLALDTGCVWGRELTAVRLGDRAVFSVEC